MISTTDPKDELLGIERELWTGGADAYLEHLDDDCLVVFTEMVGVSGREEVAGMAEDAPRWRELEVEFEDLVRPAPDVVLLTYRAGAVRGEGEGYRALVSSGYVKRDGAWKMMFHQQTPLAG